MDHSQHIVLKEPANLAVTQPPALHHGNKHSLQDSARQWPTNAAMAHPMAAGVPLQLPRGCVPGIPVSAGFAAMQLPEDSSLLPVAMSFVQEDDYHGILELARAGAVHAMAAQRRCGFALSLKPEGCVMSDLPTSLRVRGANLLHYAVCIGSFRAAAALVVVNPSLLKGHCVVETIDDSCSSSAHEEAWCAAELARLLCVLYIGDSDDEVLATSLLFEQALRVLEVGIDYPEQLPFVNLPTVQERITAAGWDAEAALQAFCTAASVDDTSS